MSYNTKDKIIYSGTKGYL